jgi:hypothetical protein
MTTRLSFQESPVTVRVGETQLWDFDITPWAASGSAPVTSAANAETGADLTATIFPSNVPNLAGTIYTLPAATGWVAGQTVRITAQFTAGGRVLRPYLDVQVLA